MADLASTLCLTVSADRARGKQAEKDLNAYAAAPTFGPTVLEVLATHPDPTTKLAAAIFFKNWVKRMWNPEESPLSEEDKAVIRANIVPVGLSLTPQLQEYTSEAVSIIAKYDYSARWEGLMPQLVASLDTQDVNVISGVLKIADALFRKYRNMMKSDELLLEVQYSLDQFAPTVLQLFQVTNGIVGANEGDKAMLDTCFGLLHTLAEIFFSLNFQEFPAFFEDNLEEFVGMFKIYLEYKNPLLTPKSDTEPHALVKLQSTVCQIVRLYAEVADEEFQPFMSSFVALIWQRLMETSPRPYDDELVASSIRFLCSITAAAASAEMFANPEAIKQICENVIVPNIKFRDEDEENFETNPSEYIRRDIEGGDLETRRRAAADLTKKMCQKYLANVTAVFSQYIGALFQEYQANPVDNWAAKDAALHMITSLTALTSSQREGTTKTNELIDVTETFVSHVMPDLVSANIDELPVIKADAIKFLTTFRQQLPVEGLHQCMAMLGRFLGAESFVVQTYAAIAIARLLLVVTSTGQKAFTKVDIAPYLESLLTGLFAILGKEDKESAQNPYVVKAILRLVVVAEETVAPFAGICLDRFNQILMTQASNPGDPTFIHHLFETMGAMIRHVCLADPARVLDFEGVLFPPFQAMLQNNVEEFTPYVFQLMSQMLEVHPPPIPEGYLALLQPLMSPPLWEASGNVPAMVRLLVAMLEKSSEDVVAQGMVEPLLGVFRKLLSSLANDTYGFQIINAVVENMSPGHWAPHLSTILGLLFQRKRTTKFLLHLVVFFSRFAIKHGAEQLVQAIEGLQSGLFGDIMAKVYPENVQTIDEPLPRRIVAVAMTKILTESPTVLSNFSAQWHVLLAATVRLLTEEVSLVKTADDLEEQLEGTLQYDTKYSKLQYASKPDPDPCPEIQDPRPYLTTMLGQLSASHPGQLGPLISRMDPERQAGLQALLQAGGVALS